MRVSVISAAAPGFDAKLYRTATLTWLQGGDPWSVYSGAIRFAAPPPSLLAMLPFAVVPETVAVVAMIGLGVVGTAWALRRLGMPLWWLAFPPFIDGLYNGNPQVLLLPLLVAGLAPIAALVKIYAVPVPLLRGRVEGRRRDRDRPAGDGPDPAVGRLYRPVPVDQRHPQRAVRRRHERAGASRS